MKNILSIVFATLLLVINSSNVNAQAPTTAASNVITVGKSTTSISINWTSGNGSKRIVTCALSSSSVSLPVNGATYTQNSSFGFGSNLGNGNYCIYNGTSYGCNAFNLAPNTSYRFRVYEYNTTTMNYYLTSGYPIFTEITLETEPVTSASALSVSSIQTTSAFMSFTSGSGTYDLLALRSSNTYANLPVDGTVYSPSSTYGSGSSIAGTIPYSYVLSNGATAFSSVFGLTAGTTYTGAVFPYNGISGAQNYKTTSYPTVTFTTLAAEPTSVSNTLSFSGITDNSMTVSWTLPSSGAGTYRVVTCKPGTTNTDLPTDATYYTPSSFYGSGTQIGGAAGAFTIYNGTGNSVSVTGLTSTTTYSFSVYEYNVANNLYNNTYNYLTSSYLNGNQQTLSNEPTIPPSSLVFSNITSNSVRATWANGNGARRVVGVAAGRKQTALAFDGSNDYISIPNEFNFDFTNQMTVEAWIKVNAFTMADQSIITKGTDSWRLTRNGSSNSLKFSVTSTTFFFGTQVYSVSGSRSVNDGKWHHVAATYNGSQLIIYIDGTLDAYSSLNYDIDNSTAPVYIGGNSMSAGNNFNGQIDEVRIWNVGQPYTTIRANMNKTLVGNETGLTGYWKLDDGFANTTTAVNSSFTSSVNGTLVGFTSTVPATSFAGTSGWVHSGAVVNVPLDFTTYLDNTAFMSTTGPGFYYGNLYYSVYRGPDSTTINVTNLSPSTYYTFGVFDYNGTVGNNNYLTDNYAIGEVLTGSVTNPTITSFTPAFGYVGSIVTINGTGFNSTAANNTVYFGAAKATVISANAGGTQLTVKVPAGSTYELISVTNNTLTAYSTKPFDVTSPCGSIAFSGTTLNAGANVTSYYPYEMRVADMDQDGLSDLIALGSYGYTSITRNTSTAGTVNLSNIYYLYNYNTYSTDMEISDIDGDGKTDIIISNSYNSAPSFVVTRNISTAGNIATAPIVEFGGIAGYTISDIAVADFDKNGKPDVIIGYTNNIVSYFRNISSIGNINFAARVDVALAATSAINAIATGDIDGDGKADVAIAGGASSMIHYLRNTSTIGSITFAAYTSNTLSGTITGVTIGDIDTDGKAEILYGATSSTVGILKNNSTLGSISISNSPTVLSALANTPNDIKLGDIDGDGKADITLGYNSGSQVSIFKNVSTAAISVNTKFDFTLAASGSSPYSVVLCDMNNDNKTDILSSNVSTASYFQNAINPLASEPTVQATGLSFAGVSTTQITCNFTPGNGANKVVFVRAATSPGFIPTDGVGYVPNTIFGNGTDLGSGNYCVFDGNGSGVTVTGLLSNTSYVFSVYEYNGVLNCQYNYLPNSSSNSATQATNNNAPTLTAISNPSSICQSSGLQTINLSGIGTGAGNETQTLSITAASSNTGLIPTPVVSYTSPNATGSLSYTPVAGISGTSTITVTVNDGATNNNTIVRTFVVTVDHIPSVSTAGPNQVICPSVATLAANTPTFGTGVWSTIATTNAGITITSLTNPTSTVTGFAIGDSATFRWTISNGACSSSGNNVKIKRNNCPTTADFTTNATAQCLNGTPVVTFTDASIAAGATITAWNWNFGAGAFPPSATGQGPHTVTYSTSGSKTISLQVTDNLSATDFEIKTGFVTITDVPNPSGNISGSTSVCQGQNGVTYSVPAITGATGYTWSLPTGASLISGVNTNNITVNYNNTSISGNINVVGTNSCGSGTVSANFPVTIDPLPSAAGVITGPTSVCDGATGITFSVPTISNASSYNWTIPGGVIIMSGGTTNTITVNFTSGSLGGMISVQGVNTCGNGTASSKNIIVNPYPGIADAIVGQSSITTCPSSPGVTYSIPLVSNATSYNWTVPSGANIVSGTGTNSITVDYSASAVSGNVVVMPVNGCGNGTSSILNVVVNTLPEMAGNITGNDTIMVCPVSDSVSYTVSPIFNASYYVWSLPAGATIISGDSTNSILVNFSNTAVSGNISVFGENACGVGATATFGIYVTPVPTQELCMVSVDDNSNYNIVSWEKPIAADIDSFRIYREVLSSFVHIGSVDYTELSSYVDSVYLPAADPNTTNFRYRISVIDTCGNESVLSNHHRTIFLQANQGVGGVVNLSWVPYEGATVDFYRIMRDSTGTGNFIAIDSVPGVNTVYTDLAPPVNGNNLGYLLEVNWSTSCTPTRATVSTSRSNIKHVGIIVTGNIEQTIMNSGINVYPNPADDMVTIEYPAGFKKYSLQLFDALGQLVINEQLINDGTGNEILSHQLDISSFTKGVYIVNIQTEYGSTFKRLIIQ